MTAPQQASTTSNNAVLDRIMALVAPIVSGLKLDLYDLEFNRGILKITVDTPPGSPGGVTLDEISLVTRLISRDLDHHDPVPGRYTLEVSSPGLERVLRTAANYEREIGKKVKVRLRAAVNNERRFEGVLVAADESSATIRLADSTERIVAYTSVDRAHTVFEWEKGEKLTPSTASPRKATTASRATPRSQRTGSDKPAPGPSDELDSPIEQEATA